MTKLGKTLVQHSTQVRSTPTYWLFFVCKDDSCLLHNMAIARFSSFISWEGTQTSGTCKSENPRTKWNMIMGRWTQLGTPCINACLFHPAFCMYYQSVCTKYIASPKNAFPQGLTKKMHTCRVTAPTLDRQVEVDPYSLKWSFRRKRVYRYILVMRGPHCWDFLFQRLAGSLDREKSLQ